MKTVAFDIDLHRVHGWSSQDGKVCHNAPDVPWAVLKSHDRILVEVASPVFYACQRGEIINRYKWAIFNSMMAGRIYEYCLAHNLQDRLLVSPSSEWTLGHPENMRVLIAKVNENEKHDLRECQCMLFYFSTNPQCWRPFPAYVESLSKRKGK